jgi:hypothetical protein
MRRSDIVPLTARFVKIVIQVRAGGHEAVDVPVRDQVGDDEAQPAGAQRTGHPEEDRDLVLDHLVPDTVRRREIPALEGNPLHAGDDLVRRESSLDGERLDRSLEEARLLGHAPTIMD